MKVERKEKEEEDAFALLFQKSSVVCLWCKTKQTFLSFVSLCDLTIDFCFFHLPVFLVFLSPSFFIMPFHRTLVFFVSSPQKKSPLRDFKRNSSLCSSLLRYTHTHRYIERVSESESQRETNNAEAACAARAAAADKRMGGDEELAKHTKVKIIGNNRTKQKLVGAHATVKKSVNLGGWHWLLLENGKEVRLQKNALEVISLPTGEEEDSIEFQTKDDDDGSHVESGEIEEMEQEDEEMKERNEDEENNNEEKEEKDDGDSMEDEDGNANEEEGDDEDEEKKEGEGDAEDGDGDEDDEEGEEGDKEGGMKARLRRPTRTPGNGPPSQQAAAAMKRIVDKRNAGKPNCNVNFNRLTGPTLLKYKKFYQMPGADTDDVIKGKAKMVDEVTRHFMSQKVDEQKCLAQFVASLASTTR